MVATLEKGLSRRDAIKAALALGATGFVAAVVGRTSGAESAQEADREQELYRRRVGGLAEFVDLAPIQVGEYLPPDVLDELRVALESNFLGQPGPKVGVGFGRIASSEDPLMSYLSSRVYKPPSDIRFPLVDTTTSPFTPEAQFEASFEPGRTQFSWDNVTLEEIYRRLVIPITYNPSYYERYIQKYERGDHAKKDKFFDLFYGFYGYSRAIDLTPLASFTKSLFTAQFLGIPLFRTRESIRSSRLDLTTEAHVGERLYLIPKTFFGVALTSNEIIPPTVGAAQKMDSKSRLIEKGIMFLNLHPIAIELLRLDVTELRDKIYVSTGQMQGEAAEMVAVLARPIEHPLRFPYLTERHENPERYKKPELLIVTPTDLLVPRNAGVQMGMVAAAADLGI